MPKHSALRGVHLAGTRPTSLPPCPCVGTLKLVDSQMKTLPQKGRKQRANFTPNDAGSKRTFARNAGHDPVDDRDILYSLTLTLSFTLSGYWFSFSLFSLIQSLSVSVVTYQSAPAFTYSSSNHHLLLSFCSNSSPLSARLVSEIALWLCVLCIGAQAPGNTTPGNRQP